jgi:hypothetical protein
MSSEAQSFDAHKIETFQNKIKTKKRNNHAQISPQLSFFIFTFYFTS